MKIIKKLVISTMIMTVLVLSLTACRKEKEPTTELKSMAIETEPTSPEATQPEPTIEVAPSVSEDAVLSTAEQRIADMTAIDIVKDMGNGWNLANTMESVADWVSGANASDYETAWGQPVTAKRMIDSLKTCGFNSVRIPVAWSNMMTKDGTYTISDRYFKRVDEIINYVLDNEMYVIINIHWDGGWWEDFGSEDLSIREEAMVRYHAMWQQISDHYKDYSYRLILESANEELGNASRGSRSEEEAYQTVNEINQNFVDLVRQSGGLNSNRHLLIAGYNTDIDATCDPRYIMPEDTVSDKLLISVHYYTPSTFCIASEKDNSWGYMDSWGTESDYEQMKMNFEKMKKFTELGYGVIIGEYGVTEKKVDGVNQIKEGTDAFIKNVVALANENGYCAMLWDTGVIYNRRSGKIENEMFFDIFSSK